MHGEFNLIHRYFAPLAGEAGLGLRDDAALLTPPNGKQLVITQDAMTAGIHFFANDPADKIAQKLLRVNLSDLAAKGAEPLGYLVSLLMPADTPETWVASFAAGLARDQQQYNIQLMGGDTSRINGPLTLSLTAIGAVETGRIWQRRGANIGDEVYVTGTLGDAALGLLARRGEIPTHPYLLERYLLPQPRFLPLTSYPLPFTAAMDISDGLLQDAGHLAAASGVKLVLEATKLPLSAAAGPYRHSHLSTIATEGDDYEILFTLPPHAALPKTPFPLTRIGRVEKGEGVVLLNDEGAPLRFSRTGWQHFG
jgi:thiamine-monophosphate kinase